MLHKTKILMKYDSIDVQSLNINSESTTGNGTLYYPIGTDLVPVKVEFEYSNELIEEYLNEWKTEKKPFQKVHILNIKLNNEVRLFDLLTPQSKEEYNRVELLEKQLDKLDYPFA